MKYKRPKNKTKYIAVSSVSEKKSKRSAVKKSSIAVAVGIMLLFSLTRLGIFERPINSGGELIKRLGSFYNPDRGEGIFKTLSGEIADFCFKYLRGTKEESKARVYASGEEAAAVLSSAEEISEPQETAVSNPALFMPIMPCMGRISSGYGERIHPVSGRKSFHNGIDIAVSEGQEIYACEGGVVTVSEYNEFSGNHIKIEHTDGYVSSYSHLSRLYAEVGESVSRGSLIGLAGSTGIATGPHLHFEILKSGEVQNPSELIRR